MARFIKIPTKTLINVETSQEVLQLTDSNIENRCGGGGKNIQRLRGGTLDQILHILNNHDKTDLGAPWTAVSSRP
jgi:hypothetical protein